MTSAATLIIVGLICRSCIERAPVIKTAVQNLKPNSEDLQARVRIHGSENKISQIWSYQHFIASYSVSLSPVKKCLKT